MNKRIQELAEQAGLQPYYDAQKEQMAKFAELIVLECANVAGYYYIRNECVSPKQIKQHFEVNSEKEVILPDDPYEEDEGHPCPYSIELHDDYDSLCHCNEEETEQCRMDI